MGAQDHTGRNAYLYPYSYQQMVDPNYFELFVNGLLGRFSLSMGTYELTLQQEVYVASGHLFFVYGQYIKYLYSPKLT